MRISKSDLNFNPEHITKKKNLISHIIDRILLITKTDKHFSNSSRVDELDRNIIILKDRILKQDEMILKSSTMKEDLTKKITLIESENFDSKVKLLESLEKGL
jgi:hypothetical protein